MDTAKNIIITGSQGLIGSHTVKKLLENGYKVTSIDIKNNNIEAKPSNNFAHFVCDILDEENLKKALDESQKKLGPFVGLVNCAALDFIPNKESNHNLENFDVNNFSNVFNINVSAQILVSKLIAERMISQNIKGSIIFINSIYGIVSPNQHIYDHIKLANGESYKKPIEYSASKSSLTNIVKYLSTYLGVNGIRVNGIVFGGIENNQDIRFIENYSSLTPLSRMANISETFGPINFLLSEDSSYVTGTNLVVDGGWTAW